MGSLDEQLKDWQKKNAPKPAKGAKAVPPPAPLSKRQAKKKEPRFPPAQVIRRPDAPAAPPPKLLSDEELFAAAVKDVNNDAVLDKFAGSGTASKTVSASPKPPQKTEAELFQDFIGLGKKH